MNILYFTNPESEDVDSMVMRISRFATNVYTVTSRPTIELVKSKSIDFIISDKSRFLIRPELISFLDNKVINLHPSFLPWNRGYHPNYWSIKNNTPTGVSIHMIDEKIDTGSILAQARYNYTESDTFRTTYNRARELIINLLFENLDDFLSGAIEPQNQNLLDGDFHLKSDFSGEQIYLPNGWDTQIGEFKKIVRSCRSKVKGLD